MDPSPPTPEHFSAWPCPPIACMASTAQHGSSTDSPSATESAAHGSSTMITFVTVPKPFIGHTGVIQRNAIGSWTASVPGSQVLLCGREPGTAESADELGAEHVPEIRCSQLGAPLLDDVFRQAHDRAQHDTLCFVNADIVFRGDVGKVLGLQSPYLVIGESLDVDLREPVEYGDPNWRSRLPSVGVSRGPLAIDWFFFNRGLFTDLPPFAIGRARFDNWLVRRARSRAAAVIDGTTVIDALHQRHNYGHLAGGRREAYRGADARRNQALAGLWCYLYLHSILDADWTLTAHGLRPQPHGLRFLSQLRLRLSGLWAENVSADPSPPPPGRS